MGNKESRKNDIINFNQIMVNLINVINATYIELKNWAHNSLDAKANKKV